MLGETGIRKFYNGPESFTPDNQFILGEAPSVRGFFVGAGFNSVGIASAGGAGRALAEDLGVQRRGFYAHLLEGLDEAQRRQFDAMLLHLAVRLEQYEAPGGAVPV